MDRQLDNVRVLMSVSVLICSSLLIIRHWSDAKYLMIPNLIIAFILLISVSGCSFNRKIAKETQAVLSGTEKHTQEMVSEAELNMLPDPVKNWLIHSGVVGRQKPQTVWLKQKFQMKLKPEQENWHKADAEQYFNTVNPAFIWTVRLNMSPLIRIRGRDKFLEGRGEMQMKMNAIINLGKETGDKMDEGTLQRYLGEMVWFPSAALSPFITWEQIDKHTAKATMCYKGTSGSGTFFFDEKGDFIKYRAFRYKGNEEDARRYDWVVTADEYKEFEGVRIPSKMRATWKLDEGDWTWCILEITDMTYNTF